MKSKSYVWKLFSQYIRLKHADKNGFVKCCSCSRVLKWNENVDAGHYKPKGTGAKGLALEFCEKNVHPQCKWCNRNKGYNKAHLERVKQRYTQFMVTTYGAGIFDELEVLQKTIKGVDLNALAEELKIKIKTEKERVK